MIQVITPLNKEAVHNLHIGDIVAINGRIFTGRDRFHQHVFEGNALPFPMEGEILYHCGPIILTHPGRREVIAAGPTTSSRAEPYAWKIIETLGLRAIMGKGGMGAKTVDACKKCGCVYLHAIGGAAQVLADHITTVKSVHFEEEFGSPEAMWEFEVEQFPAVVTIDARGNSLHEEVERTSRKKLGKILKY